MTKGESEQVSVPYNESLLNIVRGKALYSGNFDQAFHEITETAANTLGVERTSIWLFADNGKKIRCVDLYEHEPHRHSEGGELTAADYPAYFAAMEENRAIVAHDAHGDPRTSEFSESYLTPLGIVSMLDAPIHFDGQTIGVICHEHIGQARHWNPSEINYASSLADLISHALEARDRKQAEEALKESEERFKDYARTSSDYFFEMDDNLRFSYFSDRFTEVSGVSPKELLGKTRQETGIPGLDDEDWQRHLADLDAHRPFRNFIHPRTHPDGQVVYLSISGVPVNDADGSFMGYRCTGTDRTAEVVARQALEKSEERFRTVVDNLPIGVNLKDLDGRFLLVNKQLATWYGFAEKDLLGKTAAEALDEPEPAKTTRLESESQLLETGGAVTREEEKQRADGRSQVMIINKFPVFDAEGNLIGFGSASTDITELKRTERELKNAREQLENIISNLPGGIFRRVRHTDGSESLEYNMGQIPQALGVEAQLGESSPKFVSDFILPEYRKIREEAVRKSAESMEPCVFEYPIRMPDDSIVWVQSVSVPHRRENGEIVWDGLNLDITDRVQADEERRLAQAQAEQANRAKSEFLAVMSHDFRTPLNAILGFADIISHQHFGPTSEKYQEYAEDIHSSGEHLLTLVNDILDLSAIEAGKQSLAKEKLSTREIFAECERIIEDKARSNGIDLVTKVPKGLPPLYADKRAFKQILLNLLSNAVKFTPQGGRITVSVKASKKNTTLKVADTGKGIPADKLLGLTDPFTKGEHNPYLTEEGWGLGLTITKSLVDLHDGKLDIKSKVGKGTTVTVTFPNETP